MTVTDISREPQKPEIIRLAAYCRVSSKSTDQLHSFAAQIRYYKDYERKNPHLCSRSMSLLSRPSSSPVRRPVFSMRI